MSFLKTKQIVSLCLTLALLAQQSLVAMGDVGNSKPSSLTPSSTTPVLKIHEEAAVCDVALRAGTAQHSEKTKKSFNGSRTTRKQLLASAKMASSRKALVFDSACEQKCIDATIVCLAIALLATCVPCGVFCLGVEAGCLYGCNHEAN